MPTTTPQTAESTLLKQHVEVMTAVRAGLASVEAFRAAFALVNGNEAAIKSELAGFDKATLLRNAGAGFALRYKNEKKAEIIGQLYELMLSEYSLGKPYGPTGYMWSPGALQEYRRQQSEALVQLVAAQTSEDLAAHAAAIAKSRHEAQEQRDALRQTIENPLTLDDFRTFLNFHSRDGKSYDETRALMSADQRLRFDSLAAQATRAERAATGKDERTLQAAEQTVGGHVIETRHTQKGHDLFVVQLGERVSREDYEALANSARKLGGYYSSYRGGGAVPGFQFRDRASADGFLALTMGDAEFAQQVADQRRDVFKDDRTQTAAQRLTAMAQRMEEVATASLARDRKANTPRRAMMAERAEHDALQQRAFAATMLNIAGALERGDVNYLDGLRQKTHVELLANLVASARETELRERFPAYGDYLAHRGTPPTSDTVDHAVFPTYTAFRSDLAAFARELIQHDGMKLLGQRLLKVADDVSDAYLEFAKANTVQVARFFSRTDQALATFTSREIAERSLQRSGLAGKAIVLSVKRSEHLIVLSPSEAVRRGVWSGDDDKRITLNPAFGAELIEKASRRKHLRQQAVPWQLETAHDRRQALARVNICTPAELRCAMREFIGLRVHPGEVDRVKRLERDMAGRSNDGLDFFPTAAAQADEMIATADLAPGMKTLEPSGGMGHIADRLRTAGFEPAVLELSATRAELLRAKGYNVIGSDFLAATWIPFYSYGSRFRAPDGAEGVLRRHPLRPWGGHVVLVDSAGAVIGEYLREDLESLVNQEVEQPGGGVPVARCELELALRSAGEAALQPLQEALEMHDCGDMEAAACLVERAERESGAGGLHVQTMGLAERLRAAAAGGWDRIVMNPPFSDGRDIEHVRHAYTLLNPGGRLVALVGESAFTNIYKRAEAFREWLEEMGASDERLPDGAFNDPGLPVTTMARARMVVLEKPAQWERETDAADESATEGETERERASA